MFRFKTVTKAFFILTDVIKHTA